MFDLPDALFIGSLFFHFVFPETLFNCGVPVGFYMRVEDPDIHKGAFESSSPKTEKRMVNTCARRACASISFAARKMAAGLQCLRSD